jgi:SAM-dependent methyltransferase
MQAPAGSDGSARLPGSEEGKALLSHLESARDLFARRLVNEYHAVADPGLNQITVSSLLQILFLKTGQECGFVPPGTLAALAASEGIPKRMARACSDAGPDPDLFFEKGPEGTSVLPDIPDNPLREIIGIADRPEFPAPVSCVPLEEFAAVLERFLGTRVQADEGSRIRRAPKSAVLYTGSVDIPPPQAVGSVLKGIAGGQKDLSAPGTGPAVRILDPACGAGIFLLAAYRHLVRAMTRPAGRAGDESGFPADPLCRSVFGTDIDPESVSAARFVLLLAFMEESRNAGTGIPPPDRIRDVSRNLTRTIRCGNALIAPDYFRGKPVFPFNAEERRKVNAFDWKEAFPIIVGSGGFDAVIGAPPPYRPFAVPSREEYFQTRYAAYAPAAGLYGYFIERGLSLLRPGGRMIVLVPGTFLRSRAARPLRRLLLTRRIDTIARTGRTRHLPDGDAEVFLLSLRNEPPGQHNIVVEDGNSPGHPADYGGTRKTFTLDQQTLGDGGWVLEDTRTAAILVKIRAAGTPLSQYVMEEIACGTIVPGDNPLVIDTEAKNRLMGKVRWCRHFLVPLLCPEDIRRYRPVSTERFVIRVPEGRDRKRCRVLVQYAEDRLKEHAALHGEPQQGDGPVAAPGLSGNRPEPEEDRPKIVFAEFRQGPAFFFDADGTFAIASSLHAIRRNDPFLAGILNSALGRFVLTHTCPRTGRGCHTGPAVVRKFPVFVPDFDRLADKSRYTRMVALVTHILELNRYLAQAKTDQERRLVQQEIDATDVRIDALVYDLYGLTAEEITVVEGSSVAGEDSPTW